MAFRYPLDRFTLTQGFGSDPAYYAQFGQVGHNGIDMGANTGTPVYAADDGTVAFEGWGQNHSWMLSPAGICILINHGGSYAGYAHLSDTAVSKGQAVKKGQLIGHVGATGAATGSHLHFEMLPISPNFKNGYAGRINPMPYIETVNNATDDQIRQAFRDILEREADNEALTHYRQYTNDFVRQDLINSQERRTLLANKAAAEALAAKVAAAEATKEAERKAALIAEEKAKAELARIAAEEEAVRLAAEEKANSMEAIVKENNGLLKQLLAIIKKIFNIQ